MDVRLWLKNRYFAVTFGRCTRTRDHFLCSACAPYTKASCCCWGPSGASKPVFLPLEPAGRTSASKWKRWRGCNFVVHSHYGELLSRKEGKMLDPSGCFFYTVPEKCGACGAWIGLKNSRSGRTYHCAQTVR